MGFLFFPMLLWSPLDGPLGCRSSTHNEQIIKGRFRSGLDNVLHMSRIEFNELSSCEVGRLNQFETVDVIRIEPFFTPGSAGNNDWRTGFDSDVDLHMSRTKYIN